MRAAEAFSIGQKKPAQRTDEEQRKLNAWNIGQALAIAGDFMPYRRPEQPERPPSFPEDDENLRYAIKRAQGARHKTDEEKTLLTEFAAYRSMRWSVQHEASARVQALYAALRAIDQVKTPQPDSVLASARAEIVAFMTREWNLVEQSITPGWFEARDIGDRCAREIPSAVDQLRSVLGSGKVEPSPSSDREEW